MKPPLAEALVSGLLATCLLSSCKRVEEKMVITETHAVSTHASPLEASATSEQRFGPALRAMGMEPQGVEPPPQQSSLREMLSWTAPADWSEAAPGSDPTGMRLVDLRFGPAKEGECYVTIMAGSAGGLESNLNRWRTQMGQPAYTAEEIAALPKKPMFGRDGVYAAFDGTYKGVGAQEGAANYRLAGLIHSAPQATFFVKMIGPKDLVEKNNAAFDQFCQSIAAKQ
jgi:hypothetical protein